MHYEWLRAGHIICVIAWMAGMLMLPRLIVYRQEGLSNQGLVDTMDIAIQRLRKIILTPMLILSWLFGLAMIYVNWSFFVNQSWFWVKIIAVIGITGSHGYFIMLYNKIRNGSASPSTRFLRMINELPFVLAIIAIIMVVVEPFGR